MAAEVVTISKTDDGTRLQRWFVRNYPSMPLREFYKLCRGGQIRVNSKRVHGREILNAGDAIRVPPTIGGFATRLQKSSSGDKFSLADLEELRQCIIHNDEDIVVFNKPAGLAVQGGSGIRKSIDKMAAALFPYDKISLVHRLDKETSGLLVVAKNQRAAQHLSMQFQNKDAHKEYLALLNGDVKPSRGVIDNYMIKGQVFDTPERVNCGAGQRPQRAVTNYQVLASAGSISWVLFSPKTGRTHQLRLHSALTLGAPIVGDALYGRDCLVDPALASILVTNNLFLFAYKLTFQHPTTGRMMTLRAVVPDFMMPVIKLLELKIP